MAKKKDSMNVPVPSSAQGTNEEATTLQDFVVPQKVEAFCKAYEPCDYEDETTETFTDSRLREFFKAWLCSLGDPLSEYLTMLSSRGFEMSVSITGEPAIFVRPKI